MALSTLKHAITFDILSQLVLFVCLFAIIKKHPSPAQLIRKRLTQAMDLVAVKFTGVVRMCGWLRVKPSCPISWWRGSHGELEGERIISDDLHLPGKQHVFLGLLPSELCLILIISQRYHL